MFSLKNPCFCALLVFGRTAVLISGSPHEPSKQAELFRLHRTSSGFFPQDFGGRQIRQKTEGLPGTVRINSSRARVIPTKNSRRSSCKSDFPLEGSNGMLPSLTPHKRQRKLQSFGGVQCHHTHSAGSVRLSRRPAKISLPSQQQSLMERSHVIPKYRGVLQLFHGG